MSSLVRGWARYLCLFMDDIQGVMDDTLKRRGSNFGIAVDDDLHALTWQRLDYRKHRAKYAVGMMGLSGKASFEEIEEGKWGWRHAPSEEIATLNAETMQEYRAKAARALVKLREAGLVPCTECCGAGYFVYGDQEYDCDRCRKPGIVKL